MKDFFKPTVAKIIIMLVLPFYFGIIATVYLDLDFSVVVEQAVSVTFIPYIILVFGTMYLWSSSENFFDNLAVLNTSQTIWYFFLEIILPLIINYLLACLLIHFYRRYKHWHQDPSQAKQANSGKQQKNNTN